MKAWRKRSLPIYKIYCMIALMTSHSFLLIKTFMKDSVYLQTIQKVTWNYAINGWRQIMKMNFSFIFNFHWAHAIILVVWYPLQFSDNGMFLDEWLRAIKDNNNILQKNLFIILSSNEVVASPCLLTIFHIALCINLH